MTRVWHHLRDQEFWWPWFDRWEVAALRTDPTIDPGVLTVRAAACLRQPQQYQAAWQAIWRYDLLGALAGVTVPVTIAVSAGDAFGHMATAAAAMMGSQVRALPGALVPRAHAIMRDR